MIINGINLPWNMEYIFINASLKLDEEKMQILESSYARAEKLEKHNGVMMGGLVQCAAFWLRYAYENGISVNQQAYDDCVKQLKSARIPSIYDVH